MGREFPRVLPFFRCVGFHFCNPGSYPTFLPTPIFIIITLLESPIFILLVAQVPVQSGPLCFALFGFAKCGKNIFLFNIF